MNNMVEYNAESIKNKINEVKNELNKAVTAEMDNLTCPNIIKLSQMLDELIVEYINNSKTLNI